jgi:hypothetical protein
MFLAKRGREEAIFTEFSFEQEKSLSGEKQSPKKRLRRAAKNSESTDKQGLKSKKRA